MKKTKFLLFCFFLLSFLSAYSQTTISGTVTDKETGEALIGANVIVPESNMGTATDVEGKYSLKLPEGAQEIEVSYTGYENQRFSINGATEMNIALSSGQLLEEVVVIGYGAVKKSDVTGAISSVKPKDKEVVQYDNFQQYLQGRASGVYIQSNGNELLSPNTIRIRGANSLRGDNEPLYVIDGIIVSSATEDAADPLTGGSSYLSPQSGLSGINPQDIESIEILKDASATAIYGSRGANGVIIITTKKGKDGKAKFNYKATGRIGKATNLVEFLNTEDYVDYQNEYRELQGFAPLFYTYGDGSIAGFGPDSTFMEANADSIPRLGKVNWYDDIFETSFNQSHRLSVSGGNEKSDFFVAAGYTNAKGYIPGVQARQGDFILKFNQQLTKRLTISPRISTTYTNNKASKGTENLGSSNTSLVRQLKQAAPLLGFEGNVVVEGTEEAADGPRAWITDYDDDSNEFRALASIVADYKLSEVFTYRFLAGADYRSKKRQVWFGNRLFRGRLSNGEAGISQLNRIRYNIDNTLQFKKKINKHNRINGTVGFVFDETQLEQNTFSSSNFSNQDLRYNGISFGQVFQPMRYDKRAESILSFLGRVNYTLKNRYLFTASFRSDGASKFAPGNKYSFFPSAAFAWKLINESFLKNNSKISEAKLRIGYGRTGSQAIRAYQTFNRFGPTANLLSDGNSAGVTAIVPENLGNTNLTWETTNQINAGIDFGFDNDRIMGNIDVYYKQTEDLLQELNIGPSAGFTTIVTNQGDLVNRGVELGLTAHILEGNFKWTLSGNISFNRNEIRNLGLPEAPFGTQNYSAYIGSRVSGGSAFKVPANIFIEGQPVGVFWGYQTDGIIDNQAELDNAPAVQGVAAQLGDIFYVDQDGDGNINDVDLTIIGDPNPDFNFGLSSEFSFKGFTLDLFFNGVQGIDIANGNLGREEIALGNADNIRSEAYLGAWREGKTDATHPRLGYPLQGDFTDRMVEDGSFIRLSYVSLTYAIPMGKVRGIESASVFVSGQNLLLITNYSGFDPEVNSFAFDATRQGIDWNSFPNQKAVSFGLNVSF